MCYTVAAQEGPSIVIAHPGQDVELLCTVTVTLTSQATGWLVNNMGPLTISSLRNGILTGYTANLDSNNLIVENIMMNDSRNGSEYICVIIPAQGLVTFVDIIDESDPTILYVAGEYQNYTASSIIITYIGIKCLIIWTYCCML